MHWEDTLVFGDIRERFRFRNFNIQKILFEDEIFSLNFKRSYEISLRRICIEHKDVVNSEDGNNNEREDVSFRE